jgi:hypothetical protein
MSPFNTNDQPIVSGDLVTPSDTVPVPGNTRYLRVGVAGNLALIYPGSAAAITVAATAGEYVPAGPGVIVKSTGTTATTIHAFGA